MKKYLMIAKILLTTMLPFGINKVLIVWGVVLLLFFIMLHLLNIGALEIITLATIIITIFWSVLKIAIYFGHELPPEINELKSEFNEYITSIFEKQQTNEEGLEYLFAVKDVMPLNMLHLLQEVKVPNKNVYATFPSFYEKDIDSFIDFNTLSILKDESKNRRIA